MKWIVRFLVYLIIVPFLTFCSPSEVVHDDVSTDSGSPKISQIEPEAKSLYVQAEKAFQLKNFEQAQSKFNQVKTKFPKTRAQTYAAYRLGMIYYYLENYTGAAKEFEFFVTRMPNSPLVFDATYNWAASEFQLGKTDRASQVLSRMKLPEIQAQGPKRAETVFALVARVSTQQGNFPHAVNAYALQMQLPIEEGVRNAVEQKVDQALLKITTRQPLEQLLESITEPTVHAKVQARLAALDTPQGLAPLAENPEMKVPVVPVPTGSDILPTGSSGERFHLGVLLPLTGKWAPYGKRALEGILLATKQQEQEGGAPVRLFIRDTASSPIQAQIALEELYSKRGVMAVIGPLNWREAVAVAERANQIGVLNLSLSAKEGISDKGPYLFQNALVPKVQLENLVRYCIKEKKYKKFAILSPNNSFGKEVSHLFWDFVEQMGGKVVSYKEYPQEETDFIKYVQDMVGLGNPGKHRKLEVAKLNEYLKEQKAKTGKDSKSKLQSVIQFDALFIPDGPKAVAQIAPALAYFDVNLPLLGTTEWNSDQFYQRGGKYVEGAIFPAGLHLNSSQPRTQLFIRTYQQAFGISPDLLSAQAFEAMDVLIHSIKSSGTSDRNQLVNSMSQLKGYESPLGSLSFDNHRLARRSISILSLEQGGRVTEHF